MFKLNYCELGPASFLHRVASLVGPSSVAFEHSRGLTFGPMFMKFGHNVCLMEYNEFAYGSYGVQTLVTRSNIGRTL